MADREKKEGNERGGLKSLLYSLFSSSERKDALAEDDVSHVHLHAEGPADAPHFPPSAGQAKAREIPIPSRPAAVSGPGEEEDGEAPAAGEEAAEEEADPNCLPAAGNALYELYTRRAGLPPEEDPQALFWLSQFMESGEAPTDEQRGWLNQAERAARELLKKNQRPEREEELFQEEALDASVLVFVSRDRMAAWLFAFPPVMDGQPADEEKLRAALAERGVVFGLDEEKVRTLGERPPYFRLVQVAAGEAPIDGENGEVIDRFKRELEIQLTVREDNTIDYKDLGWLQTVEEGQCICELVPPTNAITGRDVTGQEVRGKNGQKAVAPMGQNTRMNEEGDQLLATIEGVVSFANGRFRVDPILIIKGNISTETGNIDTIGDILVHGDIQEGFTVQATGNITVQGMIEGANVVAGGDIQVGRGMNGNSHGVLQAKGEVRSKFIENATVTAGGKIICDTIINSTVSSDVALMVTTGRGAIIGGHITALERIEAKTIGNQSNRNIVITMGSTANYLRDKHEMEQKHHVLQNEVEETQKNIRFLDAGVNSAPEQAQLADDLKLKLSVLKMQLAAAARGLEELNKKQVKNSDCRLRTDVLYPPAQITIGDATKIQRQTAFNATVFYNKGEIDIANV